MLAARPCSDRLEVSGHRLTPPQDHHVVSEDRLLPLRSERVALDRRDPDPIPLRVIEIQRRHHFVRGRELMAMVIRLRRPGWCRAMIHHHQRAARDDGVGRPSQQPRAIQRDCRMQKLRRHQVERAIRKTLRQVVALKVDAVAQIAGRCIGRRPGPGRSARRPPPSRASRARRATLRRRPHRSRGRARGPASSARPARPAGRSPVHSTPDRVRRSALPRPVVPQTLPCRHLARG